MFDSPLWLLAPAITGEQVAERLKIAPSALYRHLPGGRGVLRGDEVRGFTQVRWEMGKDDASLVVVRK